MLTLIDCSSGRPWRASTIAGVKDDIDRRGRMNRLEGSRKRYVKVRLPPIHILCDCRVEEVGSEGEGAVQQHCIVLDKFI